MVTESINYQLTVHPTVNYTAALKLSQPSSGIISLLLDHIITAVMLTHCVLLSVDTWTSFPQHVGVRSSCIGDFWWVIVTSCSLLWKKQNQVAAAKSRACNYNLLTQNSTRSVMIWFCSTCWGDVTRRCVVRRVAAKLLFVVFVVSSVVEHSRRTCLVLSIWPLELRIIQRLPGYWSHQTPSRQQETRAKAGETE